MALHQFQKEQLIEHELKKKLYLRKYGLKELKTNTSKTYLEVYQND